MKTRLRAALAAVLILTLSSTAAGAWSVDLEDDKFEDIEFIRQDTWMTSNLPVGNLATLTDDPITWTTDAPTGDQPSGNVMNNLSNFTGGRDYNTLTLEGTFTGYLDTIAVDLYSDARNATAVCGFDALAFEVYIDGRPYLRQDQASPSANLSSYRHGDYIVTQFIFTHLFERAWDYELEGDADTEHTITLNMANFYLCNETIVWYDAATTPSALTFNMDPDGKEARFYTEIDINNPPPPLES